MDRNILLHVEDDPDDALLIGRALGLAGVGSQIRVVQTGEQAVDYVSGCGSFADRAEHPLPGLILLDLNLPVVSGHEFLRWLRDQPRLRRIPVVILSSSEAEADVVTAYEAGANAYLVKPFDLTEMVAMFRDLNSFWFKWNRSE